MSKLYGVWRAPSDVFQITELEERGGKLYSKAFDGEYTIPHYKKQFLNFINSDLLLSNTKKGRSRKIAEVDFRSCVAYSNRWDAYV